MLTKPGTTTPVASFSTAQRSDALVAHTADLDKAAVLQNSIPKWLADADLKTVQALKAAFEESERTYVRAAKVLALLKPLDVFCKEKLNALLKEKWKVAVNVERDTLQITRTRFLTTQTLPAGFQVALITTSRSLLHAAMENFTKAEGESGGISAESLIRINASTQKGAEITPVKFAALCRELNLGALYQAHIATTLALPATPEATTAVNNAASVADIRRLKLLDMKVAVHIAFLKKHIGSDVYSMLLSLISQDVPAAQTKEALFDGAAVTWQGLMIHDACICGALVFSKVSIDIDPTAKCVVYLPNDPERPVYEYASLDDFKSYLTGQLQIKSYKEYFASQFLPGHDKHDFFTAFDEDMTLGTLTATPAECLSDFFFGAFVSKTQRDARILAVPTEDVDEDQREKTVQMLLSGGLLLLNAAAFFVPVLGQLMLAVAVVDIVSEVYEGVQDWAHGERHKALGHLLNVVENLAQMAAFAIAGKAVSAALSRSVKEEAVFFDDYEAVTRDDGKQRLWKPDLTPYKQTSVLPKTLQPDAKGIYKDGEHSSIVLDEGAYRVAHADALKHWQIKHPAREDAFRPATERNIEGGWRHVHEHAHEWRDSGYALQRTAPHLKDISQRQLTRIADITGMSPAELYRLHEGDLKLPARLTDCIERFRLNGRISGLITAMEAGETTHTGYVQEQMHTLPTLPGWPAKRFIELRDADGVAISRFPQTAPVNDTVNSVYVSQAQLSGGQLLDTVINGLYTKEVEGILGVTTAQSKPKLLAEKIAETLKNDRRPLHDWLYTTYDGVGTGDVATLREKVPDVPTRVAQELLDNASEQDRTFLRDHKTLGLGLSRQVDETQSAIRLDRALTGLHLPQLANADTEKLALGLMDRVQGWDDGFRLELRQNTLTGTLLGSAGKPDAALTGTIVKTSDGYLVTHTNGTLLTTTTSKTLDESILHALPAKQRTAMGLSGADSVDTIVLRERLVAEATGNPVRTSRVLQGTNKDGAEHLSGCTQADPPVPNVHAKGLVRKVRKLYPLFTDAEVSSFLDAAGSTRSLQANRVKELEQQWKTLRAVLHTWRHDEAQMKKLPGNLNDLRVSRRQVANAIESCWRRVKDPRWPKDQPNTTLKLERNPAGPLPTLTEQDVAHVRTLIVKDMGAGDDLAYFLKPFKGLTRLELDGNQLTRLPEALSLMPDLEHLSLNRNKLALTEHTLRKLADMRKLKTLGLTGNRLGATPDVSKMFDLQSLFLGDTHSTELPVGLSRLPYLDIVDLRGNKIRTLPDWLFSATQEFASKINLRHNPLSDTSKAKLKTFRDKTGIGMGFLEDDVAVLTEQKARELWMPDSRNTDYVSRDRLWTAMKNEPDSEGFFRLLSELGSTADSRFVREDMTRRVWNVIEAAQADPSMRDLILPLAIRTNCDDAAATMFSNLEVAVDIETLVRETANAQNQTAGLLSLSRRLFRQDYLAGLAAEHVKAKTSVDPVEVELAYRTGLAEKLDLVGQPKHMRFASLSGVKSTDLDVAYHKVITAELSSELLTDISKRSFWIDFMRGHHKKEFSDLAEPFHKRMETAFTTQAKLGAGYRAHVDGIAAELKQAETTLVKKFTEEAMKADDLKTCFILD